jgi:hypothetical protein
MRDYLLGDDGDLIIKDGDFVFDEPTLDNQRLLLLCEKGENKSAPLTGVGARSWQDDEGPQDFIREIRRQYTRDGMKVKRIEVVNGQLQIDASYE